MKPVLRAVSQPALLLFAPKLAALGSMGAGLVFWLLLGDPVLALAGAITLQVMGAAYGFKDPHFMEVFIASRRIRKTRNLHPYKGRYYAA